MAGTPNDGCTELQLECQLCFSLYASAHRMLALYRPPLAEIGITYPQLLVLMVLWERDRQPLGAIGHRLLLDSGTLSPLLKRLESAGFVRRTRRRRDERVLEIQLTADGRALRGRVLGIRRRIIDSLAIDADRSAGLRRELNVLRERMIDAESGLSQVEATPDTVSLA